MLNVIIFHELLECNLGMARVATFIYKFIHVLKLYSSMVMACASKASNKCEKTFQCFVCFFFYCFFVSCVICVCLSSHVNKFKECSKCVMQL